MNIAIVGQSKLTRIIHKMLIKRINLKVDIQRYDSEEYFLKLLEDGKINKPDLVLSNHNIHELDGIDVISEIESYSKKIQ